MSADDKQAVTDAAIAAIWEKYRDLNDQRIRAIERVAQAVNAGRLTEEIRTYGEQEAHKLAGAAGSFGYENISDLARDLELMIRDLPARPPDGAQFKAKAAALREAFKQS
ncbi:MAG: Hpt domain-containing protein [Acidobacteriales bacterium]|nr:Hpt domain-containing protein [Terriglobales bacterium]